MTGSVTLPAWLAVVLILLAAWAALDRLLVPSVRWFLRRRLNRAIDELNARLRIKIQPFKLTKRQVLINRLLYDPQVLEASEAHAREHGMPREVAMATVERYAREIVPAFNAYFYFRIGYRISRQVAKLLYRVRVGSVDESVPSRIPPDDTVVFIMNHRSNMDYMLVSYLVADNTALSYAAGEWARIWPLQTLIRAMGAFFVRRDSRNPLYRRVLARYVAMATASGVTQAVYPEGKLSRDGSLNEPKLGLLDYMLRSFDPAGERDLVFLPVGINYDRTLEDRTLLLDSDPTDRSAWNAARNTTGFVLNQLGLMLRRKWHRFGYACVNFGCPVSAKEYLGSRGLDLRKLSREQRFPEVEELARLLMAGVGRVIPVLPVSLIATVLLRNGNRGISELELKAEVLGLMRRLEEAGAQVYVPRRDSDYMIWVGLRMLLLRRLITEREGLYAAEPGELPALRYYANSIRHLVEPGAAG